MSGKALAVGSAGTAVNPVTMFMTWTTYGTWLPGDARGWRKWKAGEQQSQPLLQDWCRDRMKEQPVVLTELQRERVDKVIREHAELRGWGLHAVSVRSNHVHVAVTIVPTVSGNAIDVGSSVVKRVRDQFKANGTRVLREPPNPVTNQKVWTKGGDIDFIATDEELAQVVLYITEAQDRMGRGK